MTSSKLPALLLAASFLAVSCSPGDRTPSLPGDSASKTAAPATSPPAVASRDTSASPLPAAPAPSGQKTTRDSVYSAAQAQRGLEVYGVQCASCHQSLGNHTGPVFREHWAGYTVADLYLYIAENMPKSEPGVLTAKEYIDVTAYLLKLNDMPVGKKELPADPVALRAITIDTLAKK
jgi:mono/diheme cytochrome c family protein